MSGCLSSVAFAQGESHLPKQWSARGLKSFTFHFTGYSPGIFIIILGHTALYRAAPFLLTRFQAKRQLLPKEIIWFSVHLCFPNVSFTTLLSGYTGKFGRTQDIFAFFLHPKIEGKLNYIKMKWELRPWRKMAGGVKDHTRLFPGNGQKVHHLSHCNLRWLNSWRINCQEYDTAQDSSGGRRNLLK